MSEDGRRARSVTDSPGYLRLSGPDMVRKRHLADSLASCCLLCGRRCAVDRDHGQAGWCGAGRTATVSHALPHFGEEPILSGTSGAGTLFLEGCVLRCVFCQNHQISRKSPTTGYDPEEIARMMCSLQKAGCHNIEWVSPTHVAPLLVKALLLAGPCGLTLPVVYNTGGFDSLETLELLDGLVDVYLPDMKYADPRLAENLSGHPGYVEQNRVAVLEMYRQVGPLSLNDGGTAGRGLLVRHLVLPGQLANTYEVLAWLAEEVSPDVGLSLMSQYTPPGELTNSLPAEASRDLSRTLTEGEYETCLEWADRLGFASIWFQPLENADPGTCLPDFDSPQPFSFFPDIPGAQAGRR